MKIQWYGLFSLVLTGISQDAAAWSWKDLWATKNQQAQVLMNTGQFAQAQQTFERGDWQATAAYRAGNYEQAEKLFAGLQSESGYYNQGNALAHMGKYPEAMKAYDHALHRNPRNQDAIHNRKVVSDLLKQEQQNKQQQSSKQAKESQKNANQPHSNQQAQSNPNQSANASGDGKKPDNTEQEQGKNTGQKSTEKNQQQAAAEKAAHDAQQQAEAEKPAHDAQQEAAASQANRSQAGKKGQSTKKNNANASAAQSRAQQEQQFAKDQLLRLIPDDPSGLMREKFLRDHIRRQRGWYQ